MIFELLLLPAIGQPTASDWISFAAFASALVTLVLTILRDRYNAIVRVKPVLTFLYNSAAGWRIQNIGSGPALNITVAKMDPSQGRPVWHDHVRVPPLPIDGTFLIHWDAHNNSDRFGATYEDTWSRKYTTVCARDLNRVQTGWHLGTFKENEITAEWKLRTQKSS